MAKVKQLTVALENRPGALAHVAKVLADATARLRIELVGRFRWGRLNLVCRLPGNLTHNDESDGLMVWLSGCK